MIQTHKIALRPNKSQLSYFIQHAGYARFAYNQGLADFKESLEQNIFLSKFDLRKRFNASKPEWAFSYSQNVAKNALINLGHAIKNWVAKRTQFPTFKKKGVHHSFGIDNGPETISVEGRKIKLPKLGWVRMFESLRFAGRILKVVISRTAQRWFASITIDVPMTVAKNQSNLVVGVDVGINILATLSDGRTYSAPKPLKKLLKKLRRIQKQLSRCTMGSANRSKVRLRLERLYARIANIRLDAHHKATSEMVKNYKAIGIETLNIKGMIKNRKLARSLSDVAIGTFLSLLKTKSEARDVVIVQADQWFASSKTCHSCGQKNENLTLSDRVYRCPSCQMECDRDLNAAINLENVAASSSETLNACGGDVRLASVSNLR